MTRTFLIATIMTLGTAAAAFAGCSAHNEAAISCAEGSNWDSSSQTCVPQTSS